MHLITEIYMPRKVELTNKLAAQLKNNLEKLQIQDPLILYSKSAVNAELLHSIKFVNSKSNIQTKFLEMPKGEPTISLLNSTVQLFHEKNCDAVVAIGGGSAIDLAKGVAAMAKKQAQSFSQLTSFEHLARYPVIAVPTTAGTGSEATKIAVITDEAVGIKYNPAHPDLIPDVAILVPELTVSVPKQITAQTGLDALTHAIEAYVSTKANELTDFYALQAIKLISSSLVIAYNEPTNLEARKQMLVGSYYAGIAFSNASTNLAHAAGRALGTMWHVPHGLSVAVLHPFVVEYSYKSCKEKYEDISKVLGIAPNQLSNYLLQLNKELGIWNDAYFLLKKDFKESIDMMVKNALNGNGILTNRQVPTSFDIKELYIKMFLHIKSVYSLQSEGELKWN